MPNFQKKNLKITLRFGLRFLKVQYTQTNIHQNSRDQAISYLHI